MLNFFIYFLTAVLVLVCLLTVLIVLMQRPKQEGLGAAFGAGVTDQMWGAQTTNVLQRGTVYLAVLFFIITLLLAVLVNAQQKGTKGTLNELTETSETEGGADATPGLSDSDPGLDFSSTTTTPNFDDIQINPDGGGTPAGAIPIPLTEIPSTEGTPKPEGEATEAIEEVKEAAEEVKEGAAGAVEGAIEAVEGAAEGAVEAVEEAAAEGAAVEEAAEGAVEEGIEGAVEAVEETVEAPKPE